MFSDAIIDSDKYISSKRASELTGYAQDYIGQLARGAQIDARRVGGLWYISRDSLLAYKDRADDFKPQQPVGANPVSDIDAIVSFDGREYISANRASKISGYNQDYVGQLARSGKILSRQIGNRWYIDREVLLAHRDEKNALLAAVQSESVGVAKGAGFDSSERPSNNQEPIFMYTADQADLLPAIGDRGDSYEQVIPIRILDRGYSPDTLTSQREGASYARKYQQKGKFLIPEQTIYKATLPLIALTIVIVLSFGLVSLKQSSVYTGVSPATPPITQGFTASLLVASAASGFDSILSSLESVLTTDLVYQRTQ